MKLDHYSGPPQTAGSGRSTASHGGGGVMAGGLFLEDEPASMPSPGQFQSLPSSLSRPRTTPVSAGLGSLHGSLFDSLHSSSMMSSSLGAPPGTSGGGSGGGGYVLKAGFKMPKRPHRTPPLAHPY